MNTMYYLEQETKQRIKDFHKEKAYEKLQSTADKCQPINSRSHLAQKMFQTFLYLPQRIKRLGMRRLVQSMKLEHSTTH